MSHVRRKRMLGLALASGFVVLMVLARSGDGDAFLVSVADVDRGELAESVLASGNLVFEHQVQLRSELTGRVAAVLVEEGDEVEAGALLLQLDPEAFAADLDHAEAAVRAAEIEIRRLTAVATDLDRQRQRQLTLRDRQLIGRDAYDQLASRHEVALIEVASARQTLRQTRAQRELSADRLSRAQIRAPITGRIVSVDVKAGETVIAGTTNIIGSDLMALADPSVLLAELRVDEADIARVQLGQHVDVFASAQPGIAVPGQVVHIGSSARRLGGSEGLSFRVRVRLSQDGPALLPGMSCRAEIVTRLGKEALHVPVAAIRRDGEIRYVWRVDDDQRARRVEIETGMASDLAQTVLAGLSEGERVVTGPGRTLTRLSDGVRVRILERAE